MSKRSELAEVKAQHRVLKASLDLDYAFEAIAKKHRLTGREMVDILHGYAQGYLRRYMDLMEKKRGRR